MEPRPTSGQLVENPFPKLPPTSVANTERERDFRTVPPKQTDIRQIDGTPEAVVKAYAGYILVTTDGDVYVKTTAVTLATGWKKLTLT